MCLFLVHCNRVLFAFAICKTCKFLFVFFVVFKQRRACMLYAFIRPHLPERVTESSHIYNAVLFVVLIWCNNLSSFQIQSCLIWRCLLNISCHFFHFIVHISQQYLLTCLFLHNISPVHWVFSFDKLHLFWMTAPTVKLLTVWQGIDCMHVHLFVDYMCLRPI